MHRVQRGAARNRDGCYARGRKAKRVHESRVCELDTSEMADRSPDKRWPAANRESPPTRRLLFPLPYPPTPPPPVYFSVRPASIPGRVEDPRRRVNEIVA